MSLIEPMGYGTATKAELINAVAEHLRDADKEEFARDVSRLLLGEVEATDDDTIFEYWQRVNGFPRMLWKEVNRDVFEIRERFPAIEYQKLRLFERRPVTIDLATYDQQTIEECLNKHGYTNDRKHKEHFSIDQQFDEDARAMTAVFLYISLKNT